MKIKFLTEFSQEKLSQGHTNKSTVSLVRKTCVRSPGACGERGLSVAPTSKAGARGLHYTSVTAWKECCEATIVNSVPQCVLRAYCVLISTKDTRTEPVWARSKSAAPAPA